MENNYIFLTIEQLLFASVLMAINIGLSIIIRLGMAKQWIMASLRMTAQLLLVGLLLDWVFGLGYSTCRMGIEKEINIFREKFFIFFNSLEFTRSYFWCFLGAISDGVFAFNSFLLVFELAVPFLPIFAAALSVYAIVRWQAKDIHMSSSDID